MRSTSTGRSRIVAHVDMDAFFVSVECLDNPDLVGQPVLIGTDAQRSVVLSASYDLRTLGVHSAQPVVQAKRLAPHAVIVAPHHGRYSELSRAVMAILRDFSPLMEQVSVDEAYLDLSGTMRTWGTPERAAEAIRARIRSELGLPASVGLAPTKFLAKMASGRAKPDGVFSVPPAYVHSFLRDLPVSQLFGVGRATAETLRLAGYSTAGDLADADQAEVARSLGAGIARLVPLARGEDPREVVVEREEKSLGAEHTFATDVTDRAALDRTVLWLSHRVATRARAAERAGTVVALKLRWTDFTTLSRQTHLVRATDSAAEIAEAAGRLVSAVASPLPPVRLVGVRLEGLAPLGSGRQLSLLGEDDQRRDAEETMDRINSRFAGALAPASLLPGAEGGSTRGSARDRRETAHTESVNSPGDAAHD
ncbi:MAG: DNA polymerase IV [Galactobacter sp.]